ncbi:hypothetical protein ABFS82_04G088400 [Erythranthe guttata]
MDIDHLLSAREILRSSIEKSRTIANALDSNASKLKETSRNLARTQAAITNTARRSKCAVQIDRAMGPASAVSKILDLVYELEDSLRADVAVSDLSVYVTNIKRLQETLKLLTDNCRLVILWLEDVMQFLQNNAASDDEWYLGQVVSKVVKIMEQLQGKGGPFCRDGGGSALSNAFDNLESHYMHLLTEASFPLQRDIQEMQDIVEVLAANNRLEKSVSIYADNRIENFRLTLQALDLDYLNIKLSETDSVETVDSYIDEWGKHMEFAVRHLLRKEYNLCSEVYRKFGSDVSMNCFAKIAGECGFTYILDFGSRVCRCKKEAIKLLSLLRVFSTLDKLRLEFNELFDGKFCTEIRNQTRDLVKKVVRGACEIFWQLLVQVELQRASKPPEYGNIPVLVSFVTDYCNQLLEEENSSILIRVLEIHQVWNRVKLEEGRSLLSNEIQSIMRAVEINLVTWAGMYNDANALPHFFMMNNHWYLWSSIRGTNLEELMGDTRLSAYEESTEYYAAWYMRESWEKLLVHLREDDVILYPNGRAIDRNLVKKRIVLFCEEFDDLCRKQSKWILSDKVLRWKTRQLIVESVIAPYKRYLERYIPTGLLEYSAERLENMIGSLFKPNVGKYGCSKCSDLVGINNAVVCRFSSTPAAA